MEKNKPEVKNTIPDNGKLYEKENKVEPNQLAVEVGGRGGLDPVRFGDWEIAGKCVDF